MASKSRLPARQGFYQVLTDAINDLMEHGFDSIQRVEMWVQKLESAARASLVPEVTLQRTVRDVLQQTYDRTVKGERLYQRFPNVGKFTLEQIRPKLRAELDRKILGSASLIKLNREKAILQTLQRFQGWATSIPIGGTDVAKRSEVKDTVKRGIAGLPFEERRVIYDQGHKLAATINEIVATDGGAIAGKWHHVAEGPPSYDSRPVHVKRNNKVYLIRNSWAHKDGFVKPGDVGYTDEITAAGEEVGCSCSYTYIFHLRDLPPEMLTKRGLEALIEARARIANM